MNFKSYEGYRVDSKYAPTVKVSEFNEKISNILKLIFDNELCGVEFEHYGIKISVSFNGKSFTVNKVNSSVGFF